MLFLIVVSFNWMSGQYHLNEWVSSACSNFPLLPDRLIIPIYLYYTWFYCCNNRDQWISHCRPISLLPLAKSLELLKNNKRPIGLSHAQYLFERVFALCRTWSHRARVMSQGKATVQQSSIWQPIQLHIYRYDTKLILIIQNWWSKLGQCVSNFQHLCFYFILPLDLPVFTRL